MNGLRTGIPRKHREASMCITYTGEKARIIAAEQDSLNNQREIEREIVAAVECGYYMRQWSAMVWKADPMDAVPLAIACAAHGINLAREVSHAAH
jgi:Zn ribbon nucleic-acid-binding protein